MLKDLRLASIITEEDEDSQEYWGTQAAGCIFIAKDTGRILLARRSSGVNEPHTWGTWGGKIDIGENPTQAVQREIQEETGYRGKMQISHVYTFNDGEFKYFNFLVVVPAEFSPHLNWEHDGSEWFEFGDWPHPMHFGLEELLYKTGDKIEKIVSAIKKKHKLTEGAMDAQPAIHQQAHHAIDKDFVNYVKKVENGVRRGFKNGAWHPIKDPNGKTWVIAYGHTIAADEQWMMKGITDKQADELLVNDLSKAKKVVERDIAHMFHGVKIKLDPKQEQMLMDFAFNLGTIRGYPKFVKAVLDKNWTEVKSNYKRGYKNAKGEEHDLPRNKDFASKFLAINELDAGIQNKKLGLEGEDTYAYEIRSPYSWIRYSFSPSTRLFSIKSVGTDPEKQNNGHAKTVLDYFFQLARKQRGTVEVDSYTTSGLNYIKHVIERLGKIYNVRVI